MDVLVWVTGLVLILGFGMAGMAKVTGQPFLMDAATHLGFTASQFKMIGAAEIVGAIGVLVGLLSDDLEWIGSLAAVGLAVTGVGAFASHRRAGDETQDSAPSLVLAVVAVVFFLALSAA